MTINRHHFESDFTILPNSLLRDGRLSLRDVGLLCLMLSLPPEWQFSVRGLAAIIPNDGQSSVSAALKRIEAAGYLWRERRRDAGGKLGEVIWVVTDVPQPRLDFPDVANPDVGQPGVGKPLERKDRLHQKQKEQEETEGYSAGRKLQRSRRTVPGIPDYSGGKSL